AVVELGDQQFESALERDLLMQLAWDDDVEWFASQPVAIKYERDGEPRRYTPDVLVKFKDCLSGTPTPLLCEVKYRRELAKHWRELRHKFRAAQAYCAEKGWRFAVFDEHEIRTARLENIKFLWRYRNTEHSQEIAADLLQELKRRGVSTRPDLFAAIASNFTDTEKSARHLDMVGARSLWRRFL
ncbi:MAG: heteromeric transposase endonuclease subunit TnsA, partial [Alcaligenaceae bacterium]